MKTFTGRNSGFTLVELLVVIAVLAIAASAVVLTMNPGQDTARREASQLAGKLAGARDRAILENRPMGAWVEPQSYGFERWDAGQWVALDEDPLKDHELNEGATIATGGRTLIRFDSVGMPGAPATLRVDDADGRSATVGVTAHGEISVR